MSHPERVGNGLPSKPLWPGQCRATKSDLLSSVAEIECHFYSHPVYRKITELFLTECLPKKGACFQAVNEEKDVTNAGKLAHFAAYFSFPIMKR